MKRLAASSGEACCALGQVYSGVSASGKPQKLLKAFAYWSQGGKQGNAECCFQVACCFESGKGTKQDAGKAAIFMRKASALGHLQAMYKLGSLMLESSSNQGSFQPERQREGISLLKRSIGLAEAGQPGLDDVSLADAYYRFWLNAMKVESIQG